MQSMIEKKNHISLRRLSSVFFDKEYDCYMEEYFLEMLTFERKRSERSGKPFLVMMLDFTKIRNLQARHESVKEVVQGLSGLIRETDILGWYRSGTELCVLFTEMNSLETEDLQDKMVRDLHACFPKELLKSVHVSFYRFPDDGKPGDTVRPKDFTFYPDQPRIERSRKNALGLKRVMDVLGSIAAILLFSPFLLFIPLCIKLTSRGPVLFRQERVGQGGKTFKFLKFRSMYVNNNQDVHKEYVHNLICRKVSGETGKNRDGEKVYKITNDKRVTLIGKFLRRTSLDELPQFFNVLRGDMSLAGPRPPIPYELEKYDIWHRRRVLEVKPGITGLWQVVGRSSTTFDEMVRLDLQYARNWSLWLDIKILLKTPMAVVAGKGAH